MQVLTFLIHSPYDTLSLFRNLAFAILCWVSFDLFAYPSSVSYLYCAQTFISFATSILVFFRVTPSRSCLHCKTVRVFYHSVYFGSSPKCTCCPPVSLPHFIPRWASPVHLRLHLLSVFPVFIRLRPSRSCLHCSSLRILSLRYFRLFPRHSVPPVPLTSSSLSSSPSAIRPSHPSSSTSLPCLAAPLLFLGLGNAMRCVP